ncbi:Hypothetical_protein [Hexamita inflata]|uniref:Hypothetical_protein n=1 Tax=Hexamita inflata TaxID=28002 RepID=A0AA86PBR1_9EUKA|nr:Hypothetical protein HINF_LOCUS20497 [Hexamita inflata]
MQDLRRDCRIILLNDPDPQWIMTKYTLNQGILAVSDNVDVICCINIKDINIEINMDARNRIQTICVPEQNLIIQVPLTNSMYDLLACESYLNQLKRKSKKTFVHYEYQPQSCRYYFDSAKPQFEPSSSFAWKAGEFDHQ